jgi:hypothetical protein
VLLKKKIINKIGNSRLHFPIDLLENIFGLDILKFGYNEIEPNPNPFLFFEFQKCRENKGIKKTICVKNTFII